MTAASSEVKAICKPKDDIADLVLKRPRISEDELTNTHAPPKLLLKKEDDHIESQNLQSPRSSTKDELEPTQVEREEQPV